jgi:hypothetical protein
MNPIFYNSLNQLLAEADAIIQVDENTTYLGFALPGCEGTDEAKWSICKILTSGTTTTRTWANGQRNYNLILDNYASYTYTFKNF